MAQRVRQTPWRTERWRKGLCGVKRQFAGMPKWESNSKQSILLINKKLSLNNAARSPLTPLDLRLASGSFQSKGIWVCSTFSFSPWRAHTWNIYSSEYALTSSMFTYLIIHLSAHLSIHLSIHSRIHPPINPSIYPSHVT